MTSTTMPTIDEKYLATLRKVHALLETFNGPNTMLGGFSDNAESECMVVQTVYAAIGSLENGDAPCFRFKKLEPSSPLQGVDNVRGFAELKTQGLAHAERDGKVVCLFLTQHCLDKLKAHLLED